jgi:hypothetical protein
MLRKRKEKKKGGFIEVTQGGIRGLRKVRTGRRLSEDHLDSLYTELQVKE